MSAGVTPFRVTDEDLASLDAKTREGLMPLIESLNVTMQELVAESSSTSEQYVDLTLVTDVSVDDSFPLVFRHSLPVRPRAVLLANLLPRDQDHTLVDPFVIQGWNLTDAGLISVKWITNLLANNTYAVSFLVKA